jgi:hypothetical protein
MQHSTHLSLVADTGVAITMGRRIANVAGFAVHAGAAQRFMGSSEADFNGSEPSANTVGVHRRTNGSHYATHDGTTAITAGDAIQGAALGKIDKHAAVAKAIAMPAAAATAVTASHDLSVNPVNGIQVQVVIPALPALVESKVATFLVEDSADNVTFATMVGVPAITRTGAAAAAGSAALTTNIALAPTARRYVRLSAAVEAGGGSNIAVTTTLNLLMPKIGQALESSSADGTIIRVTYD